MRNNKIPKQSLGCLRLVMFGLVDASSSTGWTRISWISSSDWINFLCECQELAKNTMSQLVVPLVDSHLLHLLFKVVWAFRSTEVMCWMTAGSSTWPERQRQPQKPLRCQFLLFLWRMLPFSLEPFWTVWFIFLFLHLCSTLAFTHSFLGHVP